MLVDRSNRSGPRFTSRLRMLDLGIFYEGIRDIDEGFVRPDMCSDEDPALG